MGTVRRILLFGLCSAACGDVVAPMVDAPEVNRGPITVTLLDGGKPIQGAKVVFSDTDGSTTEQLTDVAGKATAVITAGATVTAFHAARRELHTVAAVEPGDDLAVGTDRPPTVANDGFNLTVNAAPNPNVIIYKTVGRCASGSASNPRIPTSILCPSGNATVTVLGEGAGGLLTYATIDNVPHVPGLDQTVTGIYQAVPSIAITLQDVTAELTRLRVRVRSTEQRVFILEDSAADVTPSGAVANFALSHPMLGDTLNFETELESTSELGLQRIFDPVPPPPGFNYGVSLGRQKLPWVGAAVVDVAARDIKWTEVPAGATRTPVAARAQLFFQVSVSEQYVWTIVAPHNDAVMAIPQLPASTGVPDLPPQSAALVELIAVGDLDYRAARQRLEADFGYYPFAPPTTVSVSGLARD